MSDYSPIIYYHICGVNQMDELEVIETTSSSIKAKKSVDDLKQSNKDYNFLVLKIIEQVVEL
jgi:hypothetical protein